MKNILVTGGLGYIGSHVVYELLKNNYRPIIVDNLTASNLKTLKNLNNIFNKKITFYKFDIENKFKLNKVFKKHRIFLVIHLAANKNIEDSKLNPIKIYNENISKTINLLSVMNKNNVFNLFFSSSAADSSLKKNINIDYTSPYGSSKHICEQLFYDLCINNSKWNITVLKFYNVIGLNIKNFYVKNKNSTSSLSEKILLIINNKKKYLNIYGKKFNTKDRTCIRDYIDINDIGRHIYNKIKNFKIINKNYQLYHLCNGKGYSVKDIISEFEKIFKTKVKIKYTKNRKGDKPVSIGPKNRYSYPWNKTTLASTIKNLTKIKTN